MPPLTGSVVSPTRKARSPAERRAPGWVIAALVGTALVAAIAPAVTTARHFGPAEDSVLEWRQRHLALEYPRDVRYYWLQRHLELEYPRESGS